MSVRWEQFDGTRSHTFNWRGTVESVVPLLVRFDVDEKLGQKEPDPIPFTQEGFITHEVRLIKPKRAQDVVLAPPPEERTTAKRHLRVFHGVDGWFNVDAKWTEQILKAHNAFICNPDALSEIEVTHCGVRVPVDLKNRTIGKYRQVLEFCTPTTTTGASMNTKGVEAEKAAALKEES